MTQSTLPPAGLRASPSERCHALVPAAGSGSRFGAPCPKQYLPLQHQPLLLHTLSALCAAPEFVSVSVVISAQDEWWDTLAFHHPKLNVLRCGGETRAESVAQGLARLLAEGLIGPADWVAVHDAARPCLSAEAIGRLVRELTDDPVGGLLAVPVADTVKRADAEGRVGSTLSRDGLWLAQTPQMFRAALLSEALQQTRAVTDEAGAVEALGFKPRLVLGDVSNLKVTYPADLHLAAAILQARLAASEGQADGQIGAV